MGQNLGQLYYCMPLGLVVGKIASDNKRNGLTGAGLEVVVLANAPAQLIE
ncbi:hypothetical protein BROC_02282 [Candidatus Brocadiaceae bacterium]|nr:hypothetical protein BROC_02282 [Candidatus Brocadiaceae bacterium]